MRNYFKWIWNKRTNSKTMNITSSCRICKTTSTVVRYYYLERQNNKIFKVHATPNPPNSYTHYAAATER